MNKLILTKTITGVWVGNLYVDNVFKDSYYGTAFEVRQAASEAVGCNNYEVVRISEE